MENGPASAPRKRPAHWAPRHCLGCSSEPPPKPPISPPLTVQARLLLLPAHSRRRLEARRNAPLRSPQGAGLGRQEQDHVPPRGHLRPVLAGVRDHAQSRLKFLCVCLLNVLARFAVKRVKYICPQLSMSMSMLSCHWSEDGTRSLSERNSLERHGAAARRRKII